jgi:hypothetical protein
MGAPLNDGKKLRHRDRKNSRSAELWRERKRALNTARPKQRFVGESINTGGYWTREAA